MYISIPVNGGGGVLAYWLYLCTILQYGAHHPHIKEFVKKAMVCNYYNEGWKPLLLEMQHFLLQKFINLPVG